MTMRTIMILTLASSLGACGDRAVASGDEGADDDKAERYAKSRCEALEACGCYTPFESSAECVDETVLLFDELSESMTFNEDCFNQLMDSASMNGCPAWPWSTGGEAGCTVFTGSKSVGAMCSPFPELQPLEAQECDKSSVCSTTSGTCVNSLEDPKHVGDSCNAAVSQSCGSIEVFCNDSGACEERLVDGQICTRTDSCSVFSYCQGLGSGDQGVCAPKRATGESCSPADLKPCASPNFPDENVWCPAHTQVCTVGEPGICRLSHPLLGR